LRHGDYPYWKGQSWAEADVDHAARLMRRVFDDRDFARSIGTHAAASIRRTNSRAACGAAVRNRLLEIDRARESGNSTTRLSGNRHQAV
jgi:hypothetical protein